MTWYPYAHFVSAIITACQSRTAKRNVSKSRSFKIECNRPTRRLFLYHTQIAECWLRNAGLIKRSVWRLISSTRVSHRNFLHFKLQRFSSTQPQGFKIMFWNALKAGCLLLWLASAQANSWNTKHSDKLEVKRCAMPSLRITWFTPCCSLCRLHLAVMQELSIVLTLKVCSWRSWKFHGTSTWDVASAQFQTMALVANNGPTNVILLVNKFQLFIRLEPNWKITFKNCVFQEKDDILICKAR